MSGDTAASTGGITNLDDALAEIKSLRQEAARYRTSYAPFRDAFGEMDERSRDIVLDAVAGLNNEATAAEGVMKWLDLGKQLATPDEFADWIGEPMTTPKEEAQGAVEAAEEKASFGFTADDVAQMISQAVGEALAAERKEREERQAEEAQQSAARALIQEAKDLGYTEGSAEYQMLFQIAIENESTLSAAHEKYQEKFAPKAASTEEEPPPVPSTSGEPTGGSVPTPPENEGASSMDRLNARLDAAIAADAGV